MTLQRRSPLRHKSPKPRRWMCRFCPTRNEGAKKKCAGCGIGRATKRTSLKARADALARELVKMRAGGKCERCGRLGPLDWAHIHRRAKHSVRWDPRNALALCRPCHTYTGDRPIEFASWLSGVYGSTTMADLEQRANEPWDRDYSRVITDLRAALREAKEKP